MKYSNSKPSIEKIARRYHLDLIVLFGSHAKGRARPDSDMDIAVRAIKPGWIARRRVRDWNWRSEVMGAVAGVVNGSHEVDVSFLNRATPLFLFEVARHGKLVYERKPGDFTIFKSYAARVYYDNEKYFLARERYLRKWFSESRRSKTHTGKTR